MAREFHVEFNIDSDAFTESREVEVARILREIADRTEERGVPLVSYGVRDANSNVIGRVGLTLSGEHLKEMWD